MMKMQKILVVDDSEMNRSILADMLEDEYEIIEARNGIEAITAIKKQEDEICLVLLDIIMPEMDGFEVLTVMNRDRKYPRDHDICGSIVHLCGPRV